MGFGGFIFLVGAALICYQVFAVGVSYIAELMVESNVTLEAVTILTNLTTTSVFEVTDGNGMSFTVTIQNSTLIAECVIIGSSTTCNCTTGFVWSNEVCYNTTTCCRETTCYENVAYFTPLCIPKAQVYISGSITLTASTWDPTKSEQLLQTFKQLNGFEGLNVTGQREGDTIADFEAGVSVFFESVRLQTLLDDLQSTLGAIIVVDTLGMVTIETPLKKICYFSEPTLKCTFEETSSGGGWNMSKPNERFELNDGSVVELKNCATEKYASCTAVILHKVTGDWEGMYECGFINGSIRHTAKAKLEVALLPDEISMSIEPKTVDCSGRSSGSIKVEASATIKNSTQNYKVEGFYREKELVLSTPKFIESNIIYTTKACISCKKTDESHNVTVTFKNNLQQQNSATVDIPVIYVGEGFCKSEESQGVEWPKTPRGNTVTSPNCEEGRVGYKSRTCTNEMTWEDVFSSCITEELSKVLNAAYNFQKGLGATQERAMYIFEGLKNSSDTANSMADLAASIKVLEVMANATEKIPIYEEVFPDFVEAASNMLDQSWGGVNTSIKEQMSSNYLVSVENLVKNIKVKKSTGLSSKNLDLSFCSNPPCNLSTFGIGVNMNHTSGMLKVVAVKNLMEKLSNNYPKAETTPLLISITLMDASDSPNQTDIKLEFPREQMNDKKPLCVFRNITADNWSEKGCTAITTENSITCRCNHLTSFSVLMSKTVDVLPFLKEITYVGLGVSIFSLLLLLIIESLVWSAVVKTNLSHFRHTALVNISVCLFVADCCFLASSFPEILSETWCLILTICKHFFFLAMFCWMLCLSVMLVHQLIFVFNPLRKRVFMFFSTITGYICPILMVGSSYVYYKYTDKPYHEKETCWLTYDGLLKGSMHAFLLPVGAIVFVNIFSMGVVILTLLKSSIPDGSKADDKETARSILKVVVFLTPIFGVTWVLGFLMLFLDDSPMRPFFVYAFTILNSFQGLFILLTGCFAEQKVREEVLKLITGSSKGKSESTKNLTTTCSKEK